MINNIQNVKTAADTISHKLSCVFMFAFLYKRISVVKYSKSIPLFRER